MYAVPRYGLKIVQNVRTNDYILKISLAVAEYIKNTFAINKFAKHGIPISHHYTAISLCNL